LRLSAKEVAAERRVDIDRRNREAADARIAALAQELASAINASESAGREGMRDYAIDVLRDAVPPAVPEPPKPAESSAGPLNPFAFGIPILLVGAVLTPLFPPLGLALAGFGVLVCLAGLFLAMGRSVWTRLRALRAKGSEDA
jgi:hypothetical protein